MAQQYLNPDELGKFIRQYMDGFHGHYRVPRHYEEEEDLLEWLAKTGPKYRAWTYYKGHPKDPHCAISIKDPKWCTLFEVQWSHLVIGTIDRTRS